MGPGLWWPGLQSQQCPWEDESRAKSLLTMFINGRQGPLARINYIYLLAVSARLTTSVIITPGEEENQPTENLWLHERKTFWFMSLACAVQTISKGFSCLSPNKMMLQGLTITVLLQWAIHTYTDNFFCIRNISMITRASSSKELK